MTLTNTQMVEKCQRGISAAEKERDKKQKTVDKAMEGINAINEQIELYYSMIEKIDGTPSPIVSNSGDVAVGSSNIVDGEDIGPL